MSNALQSVVKLCGMLTVLLGVTAYSPLKASALDLSQIPVVGQTLQRGLSIEPTIRILDGGQVCIALCSPPSRAITSTSSPQVLRSSPAGAPSAGVGQQIMQLPNQVLQLPQQVLSSQSSQVMRSTTPQGTPSIVQQSSQFPPSGQMSNSNPNTLQRFGQTLAPQVLQQLSR